MLNLLFLVDESGIDFSSVPLIIQILLIIVGGLIIILGIASGFISLFLFFKYVKFNRKENSIGITGEDAARQILDNNGLQKIKVSCTGSIIFGNSYSHYFKKVRLRRLTYKKRSITSLSMAAQKSALAILDKEQDPDVVRRYKLYPIVIFGPLAFIPMIAIGVLLDIFIFNSSGVATIIATALGLLTYIWSFVLALMELKTEVKAQNRAIEILRESNMSNEEELEDMKELFKLYNIEYVNDMIIALLELIYRILIIAAKVTSKSSDSN